MGLREYKRKRDFSTTSEPKGGKPKPKTVRGASRFVIQKHDARRLHYDFRLEMEGVLKSWAVPKGLPWKQGEKHLAVEVEDHPVDYAEFEGVIPEGQYGGGTVMLWDRGKYFVYGEQPLKSLRDGKLHLVLEGEKAKGEWTLVRIRGRDGEKNQWLILKTGADAKPVSKKLDDQSVKTGRTMKQIAQDRDAKWESNREEKDASAASKFKARIRTAIKKKENAGAKDEIVGQAHRLPNTKPGNRSDHPTITSLSDLPSAKARFIDPMKPRLVKDPPIAGDWIYELKFDGIRLIAVKTGKKVSLLSRNKNELAGRFPEIVDVVRNLPARECVIDGEVVALDEEGRSSFQLLQAREMEGRESPVYFYAFDLLQLDGKSLIVAPLGGTEKHSRTALRRRTRADSLLGQYRWRRKGIAERGETPRPGRDYRETAQLDLRTGPQKRRMDQAEMRERTGVRHWRIHTAARIAQTFWRDPGWLLQGQKARFCRQSWDRLHCEIIVHVAQEIPDPGTQRLPICRSTIETKRAMGAGNHAFHDAQDALAKSRVRLRNQIRRMDPRWKIARASLPRIARG